MILLPPPIDKCQQCAIKHPPDQPHNQQSMHWQYWFYGKHGRWPKWSDAMAHCADDVKLRWTKELKRLGQKI